MFLEKSPCVAEGEEKVRYPQELECLSNVLIISFSVCQVKAGQFLLLELLLVDRDWV
jgi:hypothetical protein